MKALLRYRILLYVCHKQSSTVHPGGTSSVSTFQSVRLVTLRVTTVAVVTGLSDEHRGPLEPNEAGNRARQLSRMWNSLQTCNNPDYVTYWEKSARAGFVTLAVLFFWSNCTFVCHFLWLSSLIYSSLPCSISFFACFLLSIIWYLYLCVFPVVSDSFPFHHFYLLLSHYSPLNVFFSSVSMFP